MSLVWMDREGMKILEGLIVVGVGMWYTAKEHPVIYAPAGQMDFVRYSIRKVMKKVGEAAMKEKIRRGICQVMNAVMLAGGIVFFIGLYYWVIKAGIPYQDPPLELQIQYAIYMGIGEVLLEKGFQLVLGGAIVRFLFSLIWKKQRAE